MSLSMHPHLEHTRCPWQYPPDCILPRPPNRLFDLKGVHTGCGNRSYRRLCPASDTTAPDVQALIDKGAIVIGKTKTVEFGGSQEVVGDWVDYSYAFNSRGDGDLASTGSSTGSASSLAAYSWADITLGTNGEIRWENLCHLFTNWTLAGGSIRDPAVAQGVYGFRPSHNGIPTPGVIIPFPKFHTPGFLGRSSESMSEVGELWLESSSSQSREEKTKTESSSVPIQLSCRPGRYSTRCSRMGCFVLQVAGSEFNNGQHWREVERNQTSRS